jgi:hypothetical protein
MFEQLDGPDQVAAMKISGTLTGPDYDQVISLVEGKLVQHDRIGVVLDLSQFKDVTPEAAWKDIKYDISKVSQLKRFPRLALVTDKEWMRFAVRIADPLIPFSEYRAFDPADRAEALAWAAEV